MSLTQFVQKPVIRNAFKTYAMRERTPIELRQSPLLVESTINPGLVGTAFDYLARFRVAREMHKRHTKVSSGKWIADNDLGLMFLKPVEKRKWRKRLNEARNDVGRYIRGNGDIREIVEICQYLAHMDLLTRYPQGFDPEFRPTDMLSDEIFQLHNVFERISLPDCKICMLNPSFAASACVGGADADIVLDGRLTELTTTKALCVSQDHLLQLAGYVVLHNMGGMIAGRFRYREPIESVAIYFARFGKLARWSMSDLFPGDGFERFTKIFEAAIPKQALRLNRSRPSSKS